MIERNNLGDRAKWCGSVAHADVPAFLRNGHVFLNFSLTESFCIAILEACACGLLSVGTAVGGVPEILPPDMLILAEPTPSSYLEAALRAVTLARKVSPWDFHNRVAEYYSWVDVSARTERIYEKVLAQPRRSRSELFLQLYDRGPFLGKYVLIWAMAMCVIFTVAEYIWPSSNIDVAPRIPFKAYTKRRAELAASEDTF